MEDVSSGLLESLLKRDTCPAVGGDSRCGASGLPVSLLNRDRDGSSGACHGTAMELARVRSGLKIALVLNRDFDGSGGDTALSPTAGLGGEWAAGEVKPKRKAWCPDCEAMSPGSGCRKPSLPDRPRLCDFAGSTNGSSSSGGTSLMLVPRAGVRPGSIDSRTGGRQVPDLVD
jgi:hypothetical protein